MTPSPRLPLAVDHVLFDLDGTLTDPKPGITGSVQEALRLLGYPVPPADDLVWMIGPPLRASFARLLGSDGLADEGVRLYRQSYGDIGLLRNAVIPGIPELLDALVAGGFVLHVATSKPRDYARRILEHFELADRFRSIHGSEFDGTRTDKAELIRYLVIEERIDPAAAVMIGDREHDANGAHAAGMPALGVRWGYGSDDELKAAGMLLLADHPRDLAAALRRR